MLYTRISSSSKYLYTNTHTHCRIFHPIHHACKWTPRTSRLVPRTTLREIAEGINRGIFQEDSFSPLFFCIALFSLPKILNESNRGYHLLHQVITQLFYMGDLKLFAKNDNNLEDLLTIVKDFSDGIGMEFGLDECAKASFISGNLLRQVTSISKQTPRPEILNRMRSTNTLISTKVMISNTG